MAYFQPQQMINADYPSLSVEPEMRKDKSARMSYGHAILRDLNEARVLLEGEPTEADLNRVYSLIGVALRTTYGLMALP